MLSGIVSWRGWGVRFTDGICETCVARFRAEHQRYLQKRAEPTPVALAPSPVSTAAA